MARQIAEALKVAHAKGIVHQDLKPSNIMVDQSGRAYVMDFGLAKAVHGVDAGKPGEGGGTPQYMSPEQASGEKIGPASDIYSFGAVLYELATGKPVFEAETRAEYRTKHVLEKPPPPARINPHLPKPVEQIILRCLEKSPAARYQSMADVLADLDRVGGESGKPSLFEWPRKKWAYGLTVVLLAAMATLVYFWVIKPPPPPVTNGSRPSLAVLWLTNNTGDKTLDYRRQDLSELLIADLLQSQYLRVVTGDRTYAILKSLRLLEAPAYSSEDLKKVASLAKVDYILGGNFTKAKDMYRINAYLHKSQSLELVKAYQEEGNEAGFFAMVESLTRKIKESLRLSTEAIAGDIHKDLRKITTGSTEAFKYYVEGKRFFNEQKFEESVAALERAVALDPEFAMAHLLMAEDYSYLRNGERYEASLSKSRSLLNRVSDREYYIIQAFCASTLQEEIDIYKKMLSIYPDDPDGLGELGARYRNMEAWDLAAEQFEKLLTVDDRDELAYENLAVIYSAKGEYQKAIDLLRSKLDVFAGYFGFHNRLATVYLCLHQYDLALGEAQTARTADPTDFEPVELEGMIHLIRGDPASAEGCFRQLAKSDDPQFQMIGRAWLGQLCLAQGRYGQLRAEVKTGLEHARTAKFSSELRASELYAMNILSAYERLKANDFLEAYEASNQAMEAAQETQRPDYINLSLQLRGIILAKMKRFDEAGVAAEKLRGAIEKSGMLNDRRYFHLLQGEIAWARGDLGGAIRSFETAVSLLPRENYKLDVHILFLDALASAFFAKGDWDKAQGACEKIIALTTGRVRWGDLYAESYYRLGKIHLAQGEKDKAVVSFRRFLEIWSQADPGLPEVVEAKKQLAASGVHTPF
jgi:tetratricopeptide (TPR) repeat protein